MLLCAINEPNGSWLDFVGQKFLGFTYLLGKSNTPTYLIANFTKVIGASQSTQIRASRTRYFLSRALRMYHWDYLFYFSYKFFLFFYLHLRKIHLETYTFSSLHSQI